MVGELLHRRHEGMLRHHRQLPPRLHHGIGAQRIGPDCSGERPSHGKQDGCRGGAGVHERMQGQVAGPDMGHRDTHGGQQLGVVLGGFGDGGGVARVVELADGVPGVDGQRQEPVVVAVAGPSENRIDELLHQPLQ